MRKKKLFGLQGLRIEQDRFQNEIASIRSPSRSEHPPSSDEDADDCVWNSVELFHSSGRDSQHLKIQIASDNEKASHQSTAEADNASRERSTDKSSLLRSSARTVESATSRRLTSKIKCILQRLGGDAPIHSQDLQAFLSLRTAEANEPTGFADAQSYLLDVVTKLHGDRNNLVLSETFGDDGKESFSRDKESEIPPLASAETQCEINLEKKEDAFSQTCSDSKDLKDAAVSVKTSSEGNLRSYNAVRLTLLDSDLVECPEKNADGLREVVSTVTRETQYAPDLKTIAVNTVTTVPAVNSMTSVSAAVNTDPEPENEQSRHAGQPSVQLFSKGKYKESAFSENLLTRRGRENDEFLQRCRQRVSDLLQGNQILETMTHDPNSVHMRLMHMETAECNEGKASRQEVHVAIKRKPKTPEKKGNSEKQVKNSVLDESANIALKNLKQKAFVSETTLSDWQQQHAMKQEGRMASAKNLVKSMTGGTFDYEQIHKELKDLGNERLQIERRQTQLQRFSIPFNTLNLEDSNTDAGLNAAPVMNGKRPRTARSPAREPGSKMLRSNLGKVEPLVVQNMESEGSNLVFSRNFMEGKQQKLYNIPAAVEKIDVPSELKKKPRKREEVKIEKKKVPAWVERMSQTRPMFNNTEMLLKNKFDRSLLVGVLKRKSVRPPGMMFKAGKPINWVSDTEVQPLTRNFDRQNAFVERPAGDNVHVRERNVGRQRVSPPKQPARKNFQRQKAFVDKPQPTAVDTGSIPSTGKEKNVPLFKGLQNKKGWHDQPPSSSRGGDRLMDTSNQKENREPGKPYKQEQFTSKKPGWIVVGDYCVSELTQVEAEEGTAIAGVETSEAVRRQPVRAVPDAPTPKHKFERQKAFVEDRGHSDIGSERPVQNVDEACQKRLEDDLLKRSLVDVLLKTVLDDDEGEIDEQTESAVCITRELAVGTSPLDVQHDSAYGGNLESQYRNQAKRKPVADTQRETQTTEETSTCVLRPNSAEVECQTDVFRRDNDRPSTKPAFSLLPRALYLPESSGNQMHEPTVPQESSRQQAEQINTGIQASLGAHHPWSGLPFLPLPFPVIISREVAPIQLPSAQPPALPTQPSPAVSPVVPVATQPLVAPIATSPPQVPVQVTSATVSTSVVTGAELPRVRLMKQKEIQAVLDTSSSSSPTTPGTPISSPDHEAILSAALAPVYAPLKHASIDRFVQTFEDPEFRVRTEVNGKGRKFKMEQGFSEKSTDINALQVLGKRQHDLVIRDKEDILQKKGTPEISYSEYPRIWRNETESTSSECTEHLESSSQELEYLIPNSSNFHQVTTDRRDPETSRNRREAESTERREYAESSSQQLERVIPMNRVPDERSQIREELDPESRKRETEYAQHREYKTQLEHVLPVSHISETEFSYQELKQRVIPDTGAPDERSNWEAEGSQRQLESDMLPNRRVRASTSECTEYFEASSQPLEDIRTADERRRISESTSAQSTEYLEFSERQLPVEPLAPSKSNADEGRITGLVAREQVSKGSLKLLDIQPGVSVRKQVADTFSDFAHQRYNPKRDSQQIENIHFVSRKKILSEEPDMVSGTTSGGDNRRRLLRLEELEFGGRLVPCSDRDDVLGSDELERFEKEEQLKQRHFTSQDLFIDGIDNLQAVAGRQHDLFIRDTEDLSVQLTGLKRVERAGELIESTGSFELGESSQQIPVEGTIVLDEGRIAGLVGRQHISRGSLSIQDMQPSFVDRKQVPDVLSELLHHRYNPKPHNLMIENVHLESRKKMLSEEPTYIYSETQISGSNSQMRLDEVEIRGVPAIHETERLESLPQHRMEEPVVASSLHVEQSDENISRQSKEASNEETSYDSAGNISRMGMQIIKEDQSQSSVAACLLRNTSSQTEDLQEFVPSLQQLQPRREVGIPETGTRVADERDVRVDPATSSVDKSKLESVSRAVIAASSSNNGESSAGLPTQQLVAQDKEDYSAASTSKQSRIQELPTIYQSQISAAKSLLRNASSQTEALQQELVHRERRNSQPDEEIKVADEGRNERQQVSRGSLNIVDIQPSFRDRKQVFVPDTQAADSTVRITAHTSSDAANLARQAATLSGTKASTSSQAFMSMPNIPLEESEAFLVDYEDNRPENNDDVGLRCGQNRMRMHFVHGPTGVRRSPLLFGQQYLLPSKHSKWLAHIERQATVALRGKLFGSLKTRSSRERMESYDVTSQISMGVMDLREDVGERAELSSSSSKEGRSGTSTSTSSTSCILEAEIVVSEGEIERGCVGVGVGVGGGVGVDVWRSHSSEGEVSLGCIGEVGEVH